MNSENKPKIYKSLTFAIFAFIILYAVTNITAISTFLSNIFDVIAPIVIGGAIAYMLNPILKLFEFKILKKLKNKSLRRGLSLVFTYVVAILIIVAFLLLMIPQFIESIKQFASEFDTYVQKTINLITNIANYISNKFDVDIDSEQIISAFSNFAVKSEDIFKLVFEYISKFGLGLYVGIKNAIIGIFISIYLLIDKERLHAQVRRLSAAIFKDKSRIRMLRYVRTANRTFGGYFIGSIVDSIMVGIIAFFIFLIFRIPYPSLVATIVGITNIIPIFGPIIGAIPTAFIVFIANPQKVILFLILVILLQQIEGNIIAPKILGNSTGISSLGVIIAIIIMGEYFGIIGMIVGVPIFATITIIINELIEEKLTKKNLPTSADDYFPAYSLVNPHEHHEKVFNRIFNSIFGRFAKFLKRIFKKDKSKNTTNKPENNDDKKAEDTNTNGENNNE